MNNDCKHPSIRLNNQDEHFKEWIERTKVIFAVVFYLYGNWEGADEEIIEFIDKMICDMCNEG